MLVSFLADCTPLCLKPPRPQSWLRSPLFAVLLTGLWLLARLPLLWLGRGSAWAVLLTPGSAAGVDGQRAVTTVGSWERSRSGWCRRDVVSAPAAPQSRLTAQRRCTQGSSPAWRVDKKARSLTHACAHLQWK